MKTILWLSKLLGVQSDKVLHFLVCFVIAFLLSFVNPIFGAGLALVLSAYKEFTDMHKIGNFWSWGDLLADVLGIISGILMWFVITLLL